MQPQKPMPSASDRNSARGALWALGSATAYSLSSVVGKDLLPALGPTSLLFWRFTVATAVLWLGILIWRRYGGPNPFAVPSRTMLLLGGGFGLVTLLGFLALEHLDASLYIVLVYLYPMLVVVGSALLGIRPPPITWIALVMVMVGIVLTVPDLFTGVGTVSALGVALTLAQAVSFAAYMIVSSRVLPPTIDGVLTAAWIALGASFVIAPIALVDGLVYPRGTTLVVEVGVFALIPTVVASVCFFRSMRHIVPGAVAMVLTIEVAMVIVWASVFLGDELSLIKVVGAGIVIGGVLLAQWANLRRARLAGLPLAELATSAAQQPS